MSDFFQNDRADTVIQQIAASLPVQGLMDAGAQIVFGIADDFSGQFFLPFFAQSRKGKDSHHHKNSGLHTCCEGDLGILNQPETQEYTDKQDHRRGQQQQCHSQIVPDLLVQFKHFGLPVIEIAFDHAAAVRTGHLLAVQLYYCTAGRAVDFEPVGIVAALWLCPVGMADMS